MPSGFTIRVLAPPGSGGPSLQKIFHVAIEDENRAIEAVRNVTKAESDAIVEVAGELNSEKIMQLGLKAGEVFPVGRTDPI
jgi:hypothetical protein